MARSVGRTVDVLKFLAGDPRSTYTLTAIAASLGFNKATCHAMLSELVAQGMVTRGPDKSYSLGPALVDLGTAAALDTAAVQEIAARELVAIHDELNVSCLATTLDEGDIEVVARRDVQRPLLDFTPVGHRRRNRPPAGQEYMAWAPKRAVEAWLDQLPRHVWADQRPRYYRRLDDVRRVGYRATILEEVRALRRMLEPFGRDMPGVADLIHAAEERAFGPFTLDDYEPHLSVVTRFKAPIFDPAGRVVMALSVGPFPPGTDRAEVGHAVGRLLRGTRRVTESLHGVEPVPDWVDVGSRVRPPPASPGAGSPPAVGPPEGLEPAV